MSSSVVDVSEFSNAEVFGPFAASCIASVIVLFFYFRKRGRKALRGGPLSSGASDGSHSSKSLAPPSERRTGSSVGPRASGAVGGGGGVNAGAPTKARQTTDSWGPHIAYGVDIGSFNVKSYAFRDNRLQELPTLRSVAAVHSEGVSFGEIEIALEHASTAYFSLPRDLQSADDFIAVRGVDFKPHLAVAGMISIAMGEGKTSRLLGVAVAPYLKGVAHALYLAAHAAGCSRFFIFNQSAALIAALLRCRITEKHKSRPPRTVVFVDMGRSGVSAYICEVRETAGSVLHATHRNEGAQTMEARMVAELAKAVDHPDPLTMACIVEAALEIRDDFAATPEYLSATKRSSSVRIDEHLTVEMARDVFLDIIKDPVKDIEDLVKEVEKWLEEHTNGREDVELVLTGGAFKLREFRWPFDKYFEPRRTSLDKVSVAQGLALLAAQQHPSYGGQRFDVYPLFLLPTVDESGFRTVQDTSAAYSVLTPLLRNGSNLMGRRSTNNRESTNSPRASTRYSLLN